uniref:Uncharacterized protein n=1 Tax=Cucumis melo TaxID=3656 RepID=A0A9I9EA58_CUCME
MCDRSLNVHGSGGDRWMGQRRNGVIGVLKNVVALYEAAMELKKEVMEWHLCTEDSGQCYSKNMGIDLLCLGNIFRDLKEYEGLKTKSRDESLSSYLNEDVTLPCIQKNPTKCNKTEQWSSDKLVQMEKKTRSLNCESLTRVQ